MSWRRQLPAYSPLPLETVVAGAFGLMDSGGRARRDVETALARQFSADAVLLTDSGTGALELAIRACLADSPGAAVALPAYSCYDIATAADGAGAPVVLYDLDPETLAPDPDSLAAALRQGARAIVLVHLYGMPADPEPVRAAASASGAGGGGRGTILIEDAAQGAGGTLRGRPLGSFGDLVVLSFGRGKGITAGRGGALLAHGKAGAELLDRAHDGLLAPARGLGEVVLLEGQWLLGRPRLYGVPASLPFLRLGETVYRSPAPVRAMSAAAACALRVTWPLAVREARERRTRAERLLARPAPGLAPIRVAPDAEAGYLRLPFLATPAARAAAAARPARALGVMPGYPRALCDLSGFGERVLNGRQGFPGARLLAERLVTLPVHSLVSERDVIALGRWIG